MTTDTWWEALYQISLAWWIMAVTLGPLMLGELISPVWFLVGWAALIIMMLLVTVAWVVDQRATDDE